MKVLIALVQVSNQFQSIDQLREVGWSKAAKLVTVARKDGESFDFAIEPFRALRHHTVGKYSGF
jgi:hypothetical protein